MRLAPYLKQRRHLYDGSPQVRSSNVSNYLARMRLVPLWELCKASEEITSLCPGHECAPGSGWAPRRGPIRGPQWSPEIMACAAARSQNSERCDRRLQSFQKSLSKEPSKHEEQATFATDSLWPRCTFEATLNLGMLRAGTPLYQLAVPEDTTICRP